VNLARTLVGRYRFVLVALAVSLAVHAVLIVGVRGSPFAAPEADAVSYSVTGSMPANQAGTCGAATCSGSHTRTLIVTY